MVAWLPVLKSAIGQGLFTLSLSVYESQQDTAKSVTVLAFFLFRDAKQA